MKKAIIILLVLLLTFCAACAPESEPEPDVVSIETFLADKGADTEATMELTVKEYLNPVLLLVTDASGAEINLYGLTVDGEFTDFDTLGIEVGEVLVIKGGKYNEFEGTVEIAEATLVERR